MRLFRTIQYIALSALLGACTTTDAQTIDGFDSGKDKADQISGNDDPSGLLANAERQLDKLITADDVGQTFGVDDDLVPYPDTYWPMVDNGIAVEWLERDGTECAGTNACDDPQPSPLAKWMALVNPAESAEAVAWEIANHGEDVPDVASWFGHCPGWVAGTLLNGPITKAASVKFDGASLSPCNPGDVGCHTFTIGDINGLTAEVHEGARSRFIGARCDTEPDEVETDEFGRIVRNGTGCKGLNAGAMLIVLGNQLKMNKKPFAIDAQNEFTTEQIWNQPAYRYTVNSFEQLTASEAANLVATGGDSRTGDQADYVFNEDAKGFALVDFSLHWVSETFGPNLTPVSGLESTNITRMKAVIELSGEGLDSQIIGGEYLDDDSVGANRLRVAPFTWLAVDKGPDFRHNPFVSGSLVQQLIDIARANSTGSL